MRARGLSALSALIIGVLIGAGLGVGGWFIGNGFYRARANARYVSVRGLVERHVRADIAVWDISYTATNNNVTIANNEIDRDRKLVAAFAHQHGFKDAEIRPLPARVTDQARFEGNQNSKAGRYLVQGGIEIRSKDVDRVRNASQMTGDLIQQGIVLNLEPEGAAANPAYYFTHLDSIRPAMLAAATKSARAVAQQFANDSGSRLGPIRRANQGVFQILPRDGGGPQSSYLEPRSIDKTIRLVSNIQYYLED